MKKFLVLDIDQTICDCDFCSDGPGSDPETKCEHKIFSIRGMIYHLHPRPFLKNLIEKSIEKNYSIIIFTAGEESYAQKIITAFEISELKVHHILHAQHLDNSYIKKIQTIRDVLNLPSDFLFIVDDAMEHYPDADNDGNYELYVINPWYKHQLEDQGLLRLLQHLP